MLCTAAGCTGARPDGGGGSGGGGNMSIPNDTCATATPFPMTGGVAVDGGILYTLTVDLSTARDDYVARCDQQIDLNGNVTHPDQGPDAVWVLHLTQAADIEFTVQAHAGGTADSIAMIAEAPCELGMRYVNIVHAGAGTDDCVDGPARNSVETARAIHFGPGDLFLIADNFCSTRACTGQAPGVGLQDVSLLIKPATPRPANDTCTTAEPLFDGGTASTLHGSTALARFDGSRSVCGPAVSSIAADVVYAFTTTQQQSFRATLTPTALSSNPLLFLKQAGCVDGGVVGPEVACVSSTEQFQARTLSVDDLAPGTYYLVVQDSRSLGGAFDITASLDSPVLPASNVSCSTAQPLTLVPAASGASSATVHGTTGSGTNQHSEVCNGRVPSGNDAVYSVTTPHAGGQMLRVTALSFDQSRFLPWVFVEATCGAGSAGICGTARDHNSQTPVAMLPNAPPNTTYSIWVDGELAADGGHRGGPFALFVDVASPPANDTCAGAVALAVNSSTPGNNLAAFDHNAHSCDGQFDPPADGPDVFYTVTPTVSGTITVRAIPQPMLEIQVAVLSSCTTGCIAGGQAVRPSMPATANIPNAAAGTTYYVIVDASSRPAYQRGTFLLEVSQP